MKKKYSIIYIILIILLLILISFFVFHAYRNYSAWERYHTYFKNPNAQIESWMRIKTISQNFNLTYDQIFTTIGADKPVNTRISLDRFCRTYNKNCSSLVEDLNNLVK